MFLSIKILGPPVIYNMDSHVYSMFFLIWKLSIQKTQSITISRYL